ncbi:histidine phosphatase family protein [Micromonospora yasonensis]|uniref:histidine phosphatase family protein n=1 Tax=Micromonospora yasonensis TaxID=1128667 RepID=UPI00223189F0|nr:histidine phosphatase family protein [Micromonospora yasonensis]MCW3838971.1 histidine phosphatase family protein [Micromonospora yasonensis]
MTDLLLVRHGETVWHAENRYAGVSDVPLTALGHTQAGRLASWAAATQLSGVWTSTLSRAQLTALPCAQAADVALMVDPRLRELNFGSGEGLTRREMRERFPDALNAFGNDPVAHHLPGGENPVEAAHRFTDCLHDMTTHHPEGRVLVVAHGTVIRLALCHLLGMPLREYRRVFPVVDNCAVSEIRLHHGRFSLLTFNARITTGPGPLASQTLLPEVG